MLRREPGRRPFPTPARLHRPARTTVAPESFARRFERCFVPVYALLRARVEETTARRLTREVLLENLDLLLPRDGPDAERLGKEERRRLLASVRRRCAEAEGC